MQHVYSNQFYDYIDQGARQSAQVMISLLQPWLRAQSVADLGSGRGVWLAEWQKAGANDILGIDGAYVDREHLAIPSDSYRAADLTHPVRFERRFDLAQSLEVGEHLPQSASENLVESLTRASDIVLFSAAVTGQGGEYHINEQPLSFWQDLFAARGYTAFDCLRPALADRAEVEPWYRYNSVLYVNRNGRTKLPDAVLQTEIPEGQRVPNGGNAAWMLRRTVVSMLPRSAVTWIAQHRAAALVRQSSHSMEQVG